VSSPSPPPTGATAAAVDRHPRPARKRPATRKKALLDRIRDRDSLAGADLRFLWFVHWDLSGRDLRGANLRGAQLTGSDLSGCDLRNAVLEAANLSGACLRAAQLEQANLHGALVQGADFRDVTGLTRATLQVLEVRGAIVSNGPSERAKP
jgi:uncharacterized protein YjbI with pentapeptide repeats